MNLGWCLLKQRMMEVVSGDNWTTGATSRAKLQSNHHHQQTNIQFFTGRMPFLSPNQQCQSIEENITFHGLAYRKLIWGLPTLSLSTNSSWLPGGGLPCLSSALWCQYPSDACIMHSSDVLIAGGRFVWESEQKWRSFAVLQERICLQTR